MPIIKDGYKVTKAARERFYIWLTKNHLSLSKFAKQCGCSRQYLTKALNGEIKCTDTVIAKFKKGGYNLI